MPEDRDHALLTRFWALHAAVIRRDGIEARLRSGLPMDQDLLDRSLAAAEGVLAARAALYRHLMESGWTPPDALVKDLVYDEIVLSETDGALHG
ncbi:MAG: hypothetical protein JWM62_1464 [Frankiales bacterium]|nr:hypothetical protein [Frankiales bacterium]